MRSKLATLLLVSLGAPCVFAVNSNPDVKNCSLNVIFEKQGESFIVTNVKPYNEYAKYDSLFDPLSDSYTVVLRRGADKEKWDWLLTTSLKGGAKIYHFYCSAKNPQCADCNGAKKACYDLIDTKSFDMIHSGLESSGSGIVNFNNDFMTSAVSRPFINNCESYLISERRYQKLVEKNDNSFTEHFKTQTKNLRSNLKPSDITNCGTVVKVQGKGSAQMVYIQTGTDLGAVWFSIANIYPQYVDGKVIGCKDGNRIYKAGGQWRQSDGKIVFGYGDAYDPE